ncbi:MAG: nucleotidyltransferase domain-containing protein [Phycisphaerae bacterium]|nr:nucleotidyltransferase domain-containing protein [Phycisphaerae bacterium]
MVRKGASLHIELPGAEIASFCRRWGIVRLEVFGSALRDDFGPESDVDFLVTFEDSARFSLFDLADAQQELEGIVGRSVDLVERRPIEQSANWIRRGLILGNTLPVYVR